MRIITWVLCKDCFKHDYKYHAIPNFMTTEVDLKKAETHRDSLTVTFDCLNCKEQGRKYQNKQSPIHISADQLDDADNSDGPIKDRQCNLLLPLTNLVVEADLSSGELCEVFAALVNTCPLVSEKEKAMIGRDIMRQFTAIEGSRIDWVN